MAATPRHHTQRSDRPTLGAGVDTIARAKGRPLMPWQRDAVDVALEVDTATGLPWYRIIVVTVQRQAGKTKLESDVADHRCLTVPDARCWYTAQTGKDASKWMRDHHFPALARAGIFGKPGTAAARYTRSKRAGQEGVDWHHGPTFRVFAPLRDALHGEQSDLVFVDEAWSLSLEQGTDVRQAVRPTMATRPGSQLWVVSTMGDDSSQWLDGYVELGRRALADPGARVALIDYGLRDDDDPEDLEVIAGRHPAYGHTIDMAALEAARDDFKDDPAGWARAYGNVPTRTRVSAFPPGVWAAAGRSQIERPDRVGLAVDVTPGLDRDVLAAAWRADTTLDNLSIAAGDGLVELIHAGPSSRDFPALVAQVARARRVPVTADRASAGALAVLDVLAREAPDVEQHITNTAQYATACGLLDRGIREDTVHHFNDPDLDAAAEVATKRPLLDGGFGWGRKDAAGSVAELVAASNALAGYDRLPAPRSFKIHTAHV